MAKPFVERLKGLRGSLSQSEFANKIGTKQTTYSSWERGIKEPGISSIISISNTFGVSTDWLLGLSDARDRREAPSRAATADPTVARISSCGISSCAPSASPALTLRRAARPAEPTLADVMAELQSLKRRVNALESSTSMATCG